MFENNADGSGTFRTLCSIGDIEAPVLCLDTSKTGDNFAFGCQDGKIYMMNFKMEEGGDFEGFQGGSVRTALDRHRGSEDDEEEKGY